MARTRIKIPADFGVAECRFYAEIEGVTPLLMHAPTNMLPSTDETKRSGKTKQPLPEEEAEAALYRLANGHLYIPTPAIRGTIVAAGKHFADPAYKRGTLEKPLAAALSPADTLGFVIHRNKKPVTTWDVDVRRVVNPTTKGAIMCARPMIPLPWTTRVEMDFDVAVIPPELLLKCVLFAGSKVGLLAFRPARTGPYGRFVVTKFEVES